MKFTPANRKAMRTSPGPGTERESRRAAGPRDRPCDESEWRACPDCTAAAAR